MKPVKKENPRISRLQIVRDGRVETSTPRMPRRGKVSVDIEAIVPDPRNERKKFGGMDKLAETIKRHGIIEPPTAVPLDDGRYMLTTGHRRWKAAQLAGRKRLDVIVGDPEDECKRRVKSLISNVQREDLGAVELANALQDMKTDNPDVKTNRDLGALIGKSEQWVGEILKVLSLPRAVQQQIGEADKNVPYDVAVQIARLSDEKHQTTLLKEALGGGTVRSVREKAKTLKKKQAGTTKPPYSIKKIKITAGWVIIHHESSDLSKEDQIAALKDALHTIKEDERPKTTDIRSFRGGTP